MALTAFFIGASVLTFLSGLEGLMIILFVLGIVLVVVEFLMPGFGLAGTLGIISLIAGIVLAAQVVSPLTLTLIIAAVLVTIAGMLYWLYKSVTQEGRISRLLTLKTKTGNEEGYSSSTRSNDLLGLEGVALTVLRPSGTGEFQNNKIDVVTDGEFIARGSKIKITDIEGFKIIVRQLD